MTTQAGRRAVELRGGLVPPTTPHQEQHMTTTPGSRHAPAEISAEVASNLDAGRQREVAKGDVIRNWAPPSKNYPRDEPLTITGRVWLVTEARAYFRCLKPCRYCASSRRRFGADQPSHWVWRRWTNWERT